MDNNFFKVMVVFFLIFYLFSGYDSDLSFGIVGVIVVIAGAAGIVGEWVEKIVKRFRK